MLLRLFLSLLLLAITSAPVFAQQDDSGLQAIASGRDAVQVGKTAVFSAEKSRSDTPEQPAFFFWTFGDDSTRDTGEEAAHIYTAPGEYRVSLTMESGSARDEISFPILVYERAALMVTDRPVTDPQLTALTTAAREQNIFFSPLTVVPTEVGVSAAESSVATALRAKADRMDEFDTIFIWTRTSDGFNGLIRFAQQDPLVLRDKHVVLIAEGQFASAVRMAETAFSALGAADVLVTTRDALRPVLLSGVSADTVVGLDEQLIPQRFVVSAPDSFSVFAPLSSATNYLLAQGIPASVLLLILMLPVIAMMVAFLKQVVGVTTFGVYLPTVLTLSFLTIGLKLGIVTLVVVVASSVLIRRVLKGYRLSYTPRVAIVLSGVALSVLAAIVLITYVAPFGEVATPELIAASIFPMLIMSTLAERFVSIQTEQGSRSAFILLLEVMLVAVVCYLVVGAWDAFRTIMLARPEWSVAFIVGSVLLGRYTGLRITEYFRFRDVIGRVEGEE